MARLLLAPHRKGWPLFQRLLLELLLFLEPHLVFVLFPLLFGFVVLKNTECFFEDVRIHFQTELT